jgi:hypothetical protein
LQHSSDQRSSFLSDPDVIAVRQAYQLALQDLTAPLVEAGQRTLDQISSPNWSLEWFLPRWLGNSYDLPPQTIQELILGNVLGLSFLRLVDGLVDDENQVADPVTSISLATLFYHLALRRYHALLQSHPDVMDAVDDYLRQWANAIHGSNTGFKGGFHALKQDRFQSLAQLGAPLKICCVAACSLAQQEHVREDLLRCIDHYVISAVLLDHYKDWQEDLHAGRTNHFVDALMQGVQETLSGHQLRKRVFEAILTGGGPQGYFSIILEHAQIAQVQASKSSCTDLEDYLNSFYMKIAAHAHRFEQDIEKVLRRAGQQVFGLASASSAGSISN